MNQLALVATEPGEVLLAVRRTPGADPTELARHGELQRHRPADAIRSEEQPDDHRHGASHRLSIIDPLDGSREFAEPGLRRPGRPRRAGRQRHCAGAVARPACRRTWSTAGAKTAAVVEGVADAYLHSAGQFEWDVAAPAAIAIAAGLHASRLDGSPPRFDQPDLELLVCRPDLAAPIIAAVLARHHGTHRRQPRRQGTAGTGLSC